MIRRSTWILVAVFLLVLAGAFYWQQRAQAPGVAEVTPVPTQAALFPVTLDEVAGLRVEGSAGEAIVLAEDEDGLWQLQQPAGAGTDQTQVESRLTQLTSMNVKTSLEPAADLSIFGLDSPAYRISLRTVAGQEYDLAIGDVVPTGDGYYVQLNDSPPQVVNKNSIDTFLGILAEPPVADTPTPGTPEAGE
jgi:hypothetical protein